MERAEKAHSKKKVPALRNTPMYIRNFSIGKKYCFGVAANSVKLFIYIYILYMISVLKARKVTAE